MYGVYMYICVYVCIQIVGYRYSTIRITNGYISPIPLELVAQG